MLQIVHVPSNLGIAPSASGVARAPEALERLQLSTKLGSPQPLEVPLPAALPFLPTADGDVLNAQAVVQQAQASAIAFENILRTRALPVVVLGGDCSIIFGPLMALRNMGTSAGLVYLDGHSSVYRAGEAADLDLAVIAGFAPSALGAINGDGPLVEAKNILMIGHRDDSEVLKSGNSWQLDELGIAHVSADQACANGPALMQRTRRFLERANFEQLWVHLDVDVIDDREMSAVDYRLPGGLPVSLVSTLLRYVWTIDPRLTGLTVTIYNPERDSENRCAQNLVNLLTRAFTP